MCARSRLRSQRVGTDSVSRSTRTRSTSAASSRFGAAGVELLVRGFDRSHLLLRSRRVRTFQNQTASDVVEKIVTEAGFQADCDPSGEPHEFIQQDNESDWDFIWRLAERIGFDFYIEDTTARFRKPTPEGAVELE